MNPKEVNELIKKIEAEKAKIKESTASAEGLLRLQDVASRYTGEYRLKWSDEIIEELKNKPRKSSFQTGILSLDALTGGFHEQQLISLTGSTKHGKTTMAMYLVELLKDLHPVVIPLEQSNEEIIEQRLENNQFIPRFLSPSTLASQVTVDWIEQRVIEGIAKYNTKFIVIDHLGYVDNHGTDGKNSRENLAYRIGQVMRDLKNVAKRWNVVILLLVHISQKDESHPPTLQDIKNSSDISQESDIVMAVWRKNTQKGKIRVYEDKTLVSVMANRRKGKNGYAGLVFDQTNGNYREENTWVDSMVQAAERRVAVDDDFDAI